MAGIGSILGTAGGAAGSGFKGPEVGVDVSQDADAAKGVLNQQQAFTNALNPGALQAATSQQQLLQQLQQGAQGKGPNPALAQLAQQTGANTSNQAALMAGQRGASANPALIARQAAQQGAANQQGAVGQAATLQAQQQLQQQQALAAQQAQLVGQGQTSLGNTQNAANQIYSTASGLQGNINSANAGLVGNSMTQQGQVLGGAANGISSALGLAAGGQITTTYNPAGMPSGEGGMPSVPTGDNSNLYKGASSFGAFLSGAMNPSQASDAQTKAGYAQSDAVLGAPGSQPQINLPASNDMPRVYAKGGKVPVLLSPGEKKLTPEETKKLAAGGDPKSLGKTIPGKPKVGGAKNDYANDTHRDALEPGTTILPRSVTQSKDFDKKAVEFAQMILAKHGRMK